MATLIVTVVTLQQRKGCFNSAGVISVASSLPSNVHASRSIILLNQYCIAVKGKQLGEVLHAAGIHNYNFRNVRSAAAIKGLQVPLVVQQYLVAMS